MAGAIAAQLTAATLDFSAAGKTGHHDSRPAASVQLASVPGTAEDFLLRPGGVATIVPFLGAPR